MTDITPQIHTEELSKKEKVRARNRAYYKANKEKYVTYQEANKEKILINRKLYNKRNRQKRRDYYNVNKEQILTRNKFYREANKEKIQARDKFYREANKEKIQARYQRIDREKKQVHERAYYRANKEKLSLQRRQRYTSNELYGIKQKLRLCVTGTFRRIKQNKPTNTLSLLGCTWEEAKKHIESKFVEGMTWYNHGMFGWHIDHIIPIASATTIEDICKLNHISNLQPLWAKDNLTKGKK